MDTKEYLQSVDYPGRIVAAGWDEDGRQMAFYAITGRSENSRNRILVSENGCIRTKAYDESKLTDPSLVIYAASKCIDDCLIVTNGDHTDTIYDYLKKGRSIEEALVSRTYEPDEPSFTPRIGSVIYSDHILFFIIRRENGKPRRLLWRYEKENGVCHVIHTYEADGNPLPSFRGAPVRVDSSSDFLEEAWSALNPEYRVAAYLKTSAGERIINALEGKDGKA